MLSEQDRDELHAKLNALLDRIHDKASTKFGNMGVIDWTIAQLREEMERII